MRKFVLLAALAALASGIAPVLAHHAYDPCGDTQHRSQRSPNGSCEGQDGNISCPGGTKSPSDLAHTYRDANNNVEVCVTDGDELRSYEGRYGMHRNNERVTVYADGGNDNGTIDNFGFDWVRVDVAANASRVCVYRGDRGSAFLSGSGHDSSAENTGSPLLGPAGALAPGLGSNGWSQCFGNPVRPARGPSTPDVSTAVSEPSTALISAN